VGLAGGAVAAVQGDEILDVGGDQCPSLCRRVGEDLFVGQSRQGWIGDNRHHVVALSAELPGDVVGEHLVQQQRLAHRLTGQESALAQPRLLRGFLGCVSGGDLRVDLGGVGSPVADSGVHHA